MVSQEILNTQELTNKLIDYIGCAFTDRLDRDRILIEIAAQMILSSFAGPGSDVANFTTSQVICRLAIVENIIMEGVK